MGTLYGKYWFGDYNGLLFYLTRNTSGTLVRHPVNLVDPPQYPFLIFGIGQGPQGSLYLLGDLNSL